MARARRPVRIEPDSPGERAAAELRGWLEAGERIVVLLAPRGAPRRRVLEALAVELEGRFVAMPWSAGVERAGTPRPTTVDELRGGRGPRTLLVVEEGEGLGAEGARVLRALASDPSGERCAAVALAPEEAGAVLGGLGPGLEVVVLRSERNRGSASWLRTAAGGAAALLAAASFGIALALLVPRFAPAPPEPAPSAPEALPPIAAPGPAALAPVAAPRELPGPTGEKAPAQPARAAQKPAPAPRSPARRAPETAPGAESVASSEPPPEAAAGWLVVNAIPRARIAVDGAAIGETPIVRHPISGGQHRVSARFDDGREDTRTVEVAGREHYLLFDGRR